MTIASAHAEIRNLCDMKFGFGVSLDFLNLAVVSEIARIQSGPFLKNLPFPHPGLAVTCELSNNAVQITPQAGTVDFRIDAKLTIIIHLDKNPASFLSKDEIAFSGGQATIAPNAADTRLVFAPGSQGKFTVALGNDPANLGTLLQQVGLVDAAGAPDFTKFNLLRTASLIMNDRSFFVYLVETLPFPDLLGTLTSFKPLPPLLLGTTSTHFVVYSENVQTPIPGCPIGGNAFHELEWTSLDSKTTAVSVKQSDAAIKTVATDVADSKIPDKAARLTSANAFVYYFPKTVLFDYTFGKCKPSVTASDSGSYAGIQWYYAITAALKSVTVAFQGVSPTEGRLIVDIPFQVFGQAGASIKVGCIDYSIGNVACHGIVDPFQFEVLGGYNKTRSEIYMTAAINKIDVELKWTTGLGFPIDQISSWLLNRVMDAQAEKVIGARIDIFRLPISDIFKLKAYGYYASNFESNATSDSLLYALDGGID
ncbi:hypothetical protein [Rhodopseudomonas palustris]|nr:hypothetical protein [Rhodopseudomonas palustris]